MEVVLMFKYTKLLTFFNENIYDLCCPPGQLSDIVIHLNHFHWIIKLFIIVSLIKVLVDVALEILICAVIHEIVTEWTDTPNVAKDMLLEVTVWNVCRERTRTYGTNLHPFTESIFKSVK